MTGRGSAVSPDRILIVGAMVVGPEFGPLAALSVVLAGVLTLIVQRIWWARIAPGRAARTGRSGSGLPGQRGPAPSRGREYSTPASDHR